MNRSRRVKDMTREEALEVLGTDNLFRSINTTVELLRKVDPDCVVTTYMIRRLIDEGELKFRRIGVKYVVNVKSVIDYLNYSGEWEANRS